MAPSTQTHITYIEPLLSSPTYIIYVPHKRLTQWSYLHMYVYCKTTPFNSHIHIINTKHITSLLVLCAQHPQFIRVYKYKDKYSQCWSILALIHWFIESHFKNEKFVIWAIWSFGLSSSAQLSNHLVHAHTHTRTYIYIYIYITQQKQHIVLITQIFDIIEISMKCW